MTPGFPRRVAGGPNEGWLTLVFVALMALAMATAMDDAAWVLGTSELTDFLAIATLGGVLAGFVGSKVGWNRWVAHAVGAAFAALTVPLLVGQALVPGAGLAAGFAATAEHAVEAWRHLIVLGRETTPAYGHHLWILGLLCWGTAQFAAAAVFRHRRPLNAVVSTGAVLVACMAATEHVQIWFLVVFSVSALFLLARLHALEEQSTWMRRRIGDPTAIRAIYLRGGLVFTSLAVAGALALTAAATSKPLAGAWDELKPLILDVGGALQRFLPTLEGGRGIGGSRFGPQAIIGGTWTFSDGVAVTIERPPGDDYPYYWRVVAFDKFINSGWEWTGGDDTVPVPRDAGDELFEGSLDQVAAPGTHDVSFRVTPVDLIGSWAVSPLSPLTVDRASVLLGAGGEGFFQAVDVPGSGPYTITARVWLEGDENGGLTQNKLRAAGTAYAPALVSRYTQLTPEAVGPNAARVLEQARRRVAAKGIGETPFDLAIALQDELRSSSFHYDKTVTEIQAKCGDLSRSECFATYKRGFCRHYATLMAVLLRHEKVPARVVEGYLPGDVDESTGIESVPNGAGHAWVEVYFPGVGWYPFDPTGSDVSETHDLPEGRVVPSARPSLFPSIATGSDGPDGPSRRPSAVPPTTGPNRPTAPGGFVVITLVMLVAMALIAFLAWRRGSRRPVTPEGAWAGIGRLAARLGFGPRPTETAFEYASALGDVLPQMRPDLEAVAQGRVEVAYGGRVLDNDRIQAIRAAYRTLRVGLLRLVLRRRERRRQAAQLERRR
ncbi:MAG TPA: DUF4129 domain-containing transglutaminase family protein [Candidatus Limnocylindrales bacterium]|nr:DUF4129 domain-containing transglutaminase family protein [Candidatus Limnocylindrales bacterium]